MKGGDIRRTPSDCTTVCKGEQLWVYNQESEHCFFPIWKVLCICFPQFFHPTLFFCQIHVTRFPKKSRFGLAALGNCPEAQQGSTWTYQVFAFNCYSIKKGWKLVEFYQTIGIYIYILYTLYIYFIYTLYIHYIYTLYILYIYTLYILYIYFIYIYIYIYTVYTIYIYTTYTLYTLYIPYIFFIYTIYTLYIYTLYLLYIYFIYTLYILYIYFIYTIYIYLYI